jgi:diaminopimelate epimerase
VLLGHGTENDFVVLPDPDGSVWPESRLTPEMVRRLCDRRAGLGADGVLRLVPSRDVPDAPAVLGTDLDHCIWFMDHRNADGSHAEMCGNGIRLFLHALVTDRMLDRDACEDGVLVGTRGGPRRVGATRDGRYWVDMGPARPFGEGKAVLSGQVFPGLAISMGNPHLAAVTDVPVDTLDLTTAPEVDAGLFPDGVNVEVVNPLPDDGGEPHVRMRVFERGVGETMSCGSGACAVAAVTVEQLDLMVGTVAVDLPGGRLTVVIAPDRCILSGPAVIVATGEVLA